MPNSFIQNVNLLALKLANRIDEIIEASASAQANIDTISIIYDDVQIRYQEIVSIDDKIDSVSEQINVFDDGYDAKKSEINTLIETAQDVGRTAISELNDGSAILFSNLTAMNQSIATANVLKHDISSSTLAAADVNAYLNSTIIRSDNAQNALDLKVQQNLLALDDIINDNVMTMESKAQSAGDMIDLKIAMAVEARNSLSTIENSVLIAAASADKAALAYEQVSDLKVLVDGVMDAATLKATVLNEAIHQGNLITLDLQSKTNGATAASNTLSAVVQSAITPTQELQSAIAQWSTIDLVTLNAVAHAEYERLIGVIPIAQNLSSETQSAITAASNIMQATTLGNTLLNAIQTANTQANGYIATIDDAITNSVDAKVEEIIGIVADAKIAEITAVAISNQEAIDGINDADISALEM